ncbi:exo-rhamnogalacturonase B [Auricularia subglabra TFB-10046 SS5]|nr:exo-rhamnogalacturonase B [Auricularia subglabra TFB-10046 SS5]
MLRVFLTLLIPAVAVIRSTATPAVATPESAYWRDQARLQLRRLCVVFPDCDGGDDAPAITRALNHDCRKKGLVVLPGPQYKIATLMNTTAMDDVVIHQFGKFLWTPDIDYWLSVSEEVGFQNQSSVWFFGGDRVTWDGHGDATLDGNGQVWYNWARGRGNLPHRPMMINFRGLNNSVVRGVNFFQTQMWTMALMWSNNVIMEDIYVNNTSTRPGEAHPLNTDGFDSLYSDNITLRRWKIKSGDDAIALKGNSTNFFVEDIEIWGGQGFAVGSIGQYNGVYEVVENFFVRNVTLHNANYVLYLKSWPGKQYGYPPNGGGGGYGHGRNVVFEDIKIDQGRSQPFYVIQCENYEGHSGEDCDSSKFHFLDVTWRNVKGTVNSNVERASYFICSEAAGGCTNFTVADFDVRPVGKDAILSKWSCHNVNANNGFECNDLF